MPTFRVNRRLRVRYQNHPTFVWALPLHDAIAHHQLAIVELLITERGAAVDKQSVECITPLELVVRKLHEKVIAGPWPKRVPV